MEKLKEIGLALLVFGVASYLLSLANLQFKVLGFLGGNKIYVEIASIGLGLLFIIVAKLASLKEDANKEDNSNN